MIRNEQNLCKNNNFNKVNSFVLSLFTGGDQFFGFNFIV